MPSGYHRKTVNQNQIEKVLVFYHTGNESTATIEPDGWRDPDAEDIAILRLNGPLPEGVNPLPLGVSIGVAGHRFQTFGFPDATLVSGMHGDGHILGLVLLNGVEMLQLRSQEVNGGFSGAPVWDEIAGQVVGMVTATTSPDERGRLTETAFAIPTETLLKVWPSLPIGSPLIGQPLPPPASLSSLQTMLPPGIRPGESPPFYRLDEYTFQQLCRDLFDAEPDIATCEVYGQRGQAQNGIDLLAHRQRDEGIEVGQCKCYARFSPSDIRRASDEFFAHRDRWLQEDVKRFILFVACDLSSRQQQDEIITQRQRFAEFGIAYEVWSAANIRNKLRPHRGIVATYLAPPEYWVQAICGVTSPPSPSIVPLTDLPRELLDRPSEQPQEGRIPLFIRPDEFEARLEKGTPFRYAIPLVGRAGDLSKLEQALSQSEVEVVVLSGPPGVGKTKLSLELARHLQGSSSFSDCDIAFARETVESIEGHWDELDPTRRLILFVDDAHHLSHLRQLAELRVNDQLTAGTKFVLITNDLQKQAVIRELNVYAGIQEHDVTLLTPRDIDTILANPPFEVHDKEIRENIARLSEGNPLFAQIGLQVVRDGGSLRELPRTEILTRYIDDKLYELEQRHPDSNHRAYLSTLAGLRNIEWTNEPLRERVREVLSLTKDEEERLVSDLEAAGLVAWRWGDSLRITSDLLGAHILITDYFEPKTKRFNFYERIFDPFMPWKIFAIVSNLVDAESIGSYYEAGHLLDWWIAEIEKAIERGNSFERYQAIEALNQVVYQRPDDVLRIVSTMLEGPESEDVSVPGLFGERVVGQSDILNSIVEILDKTWRLGLHPGLDYLFRLAVHNESDDRFASVRSRARDTITRVASIEPGKSFTIYETVLDYLSNLLEENGPEGAQVAASILRSIYRMTFFRAKTSPLDINVIETSEGSFHPHQAFRLIRDRAIELLQKAYEKADTIALQVELINILDNVINDYRQAEGGNDPELKDFLAQEFEPIAEWLSALLGSAPPLPLRAAIWDWTHRVYHYGQHSSPAIRNLIGSLVDDEQLKLYRALVEPYHWDIERRYVDLEEREAQRREYILSIFESLTLETVEQVTAELAQVAREARKVDRADLWELSQLMYLIGRDKSDCASEMIAVIQRKGRALTQYLGNLLSGMASVQIEAVEKYVLVWRESRDDNLLAAVARVLWYLEGDVFSSTVGTLIDLEHQDWDQKLIPVLVARAVGRGDTESTSRLQQIAARASEATLQVLAGSLYGEMRQRHRHAMKLPSKDFLDLVENFKRLPSIGQDNFEIDNCLVQAVYLAPDRVMGWLEQRIEGEVRNSQRNNSSKICQFTSEIARFLGRFKFWGSLISASLDDSPILQFHAVPLAGARFIRAFQETNYFPDAVRRVRNWLLQEHVSYLWPWYGRRMLKEMCPGIGPVLQEALLEWIKSGDEQRQVCAVSILGAFNEWMQVTFPRKSGHEAKPNKSCIIPLSEGKRWKRPDGRTRVSSNLRHSGCLKPASRVPPKSNGTWASAPDVCPAGSESLPRMVPGPFPAKGVSRLTKNVSGS